MRRLQDNGSRMPKKDGLLAGEEAASPASAQAIGLSIGSLVAGWVAYDLLCRSPIGRHTGLLALGVFILIAIASVGYTNVFSGRAVTACDTAVLPSLMNSADRMRPLRILTSSL